LNEGEQVVQRDRYHAAKDRFRLDLPEKREIFRADTSAGGRSPSMSTEIKKEIALEIAHVLFIDIVGYSKLSINNQNAAVEELNQVVRVSDQLQRAEAASRLLKIATGDGMALVFYTSLEAPAQCALEISRALKEHPRLHVRMGIHSGPVSGVVDVNGRPNLAGAGINMAQRVMACGDAGHILVSKHVAEDLEEYEHWRPLLHDLGICEVKHGMRVAIANLYSDQIGNPRLPKKFQALKKRSARMRWAAMTAVLLALVAIVAGIANFSRYRMRGTLATPEKSIAVLPFDNLSEEKANAYFTDGIQDEILTKLAGIGDVKVISRSSTAKYKSKPEDLRTVANQLGVATVLEGSVQRAADKVRVNVQLLDARSDTHLWAKSYDRDLRDIFAVESDVAQEIAEALRAKLSPRQAKALIAAPTRDTEAYDLFLKGEYQERQAESTESVDFFDRAETFYRQALARDPSFALAYARLAYSRLNRHWFSNRLNSAQLEEVKSNIEHALAMAPELPEAHLALGIFYYWGHRDYESALKGLDRAIELQPSNSDSRTFRAAIYRRRSEWRRSLVESERALELNPRESFSFTDIGDTYLSLRRWSEAELALTRALALDPHNINAGFHLADTYINSTGDIRRARQAGEGISEAKGQVSPYGIVISQMIGEMPVYLDVLERRFSDALKASDVRPTNTAEERLNKLKARVGIQVVAGQSRAAKSEAEQARPLLEAQLAQRAPGDRTSLTESAWVYVCLGRKEDALRIAREATEALPIEKDALVGAYFLTGLAQIDAHIGRPEEAVKILRRLLVVPAGEYVSIARLKIDPVWDPIRNDPDFQKLLSEPEPETIYK
jgi:TolB-like protein/class 3 adenylate cyclase/predicted Zn-dependent protease